MKIARATSIRLSRAVLAAAIAIALSSPIHAADPEPTSGDQAANRAATNELGSTDSNRYNERNEDGNLRSLDQSDDETAAARSAASERDRANDGRHDDLDEDGGSLTQLDGFDDDFDDDFDADRTAATERKPADNSVHNERDQDGDTLTPFDQSNDVADVEMTRSIREQLVDDDTLGTNAQNVKVITIAGTVTLRGTVESTQEHARVVAIANDVAGAGRVVDELEVIEDESYTLNSKGE